MVAMAIITTHDRRDPCPPIGGHGRRPRHRAVGRRCGSVARESLEASGRKPRRPN